MSLRRADRFASRELIVRQRRIYESNISVRPGENLTQADMKQLSKASKAEISEIMTPILSETKKAMLNAEGVKNVKPLDARIEQSKNLTS